MAARKRASGTDFQFLESDFERFRPELQRNPEHNAARLEVRRKLDALGKGLVEELREPDLALASRASLHHPYRFNRFKVDSQWVYLSRSPGERRELKRILGVELGKDLDQNYVHVILVLEIHHHGLEVALRIHKDAWWDGENFKRRTAKIAEREELSRLCSRLDGYGLRIHDHRRIRPCPELTAAEVAEARSFYTPGEHWLHVAREVPREHSFVSEAGFFERLTEEFRRLLPLYRYIRWTPENNYLFI
ncbi:MAG: hypothetical protein V3T77_04950 [Planctomycetota bacterium]